ncbi:serine hydrolase domain-containing protein [Parahaliea aestuarii]|uniref:Beta-lactamase family protein n=1 Tax=Parahaliea aestuarii TaxID=1852021 RepID=A0A5C8ZUD1_9GAMM|nr:serine hydrolase domain-containing protein [Parahaliea aestuarii]TXS91067.1 beta-lactamase family protein [Parahaliea aestuarii]
MQPSSLSSLRNAGFAPVLAALLGSTLSACSDSSDPAPAVPLPPEPSPPAYSFSAVDDRFQRFLDESEVFDGISYTIVDREQGIVHESALGDHTLDIVVMLASTSKMPTAALLMALHEDDTLDYDVAASIDNYLPWEGVYGAATSIQLLSNTSGIPGLEALSSYGAHLCQYAPAGTLENCARTIYSTPLANSQPPGTSYSYGGSQWQLAGAVAEQVSNSSWRQAFDSYIAEPCDLEVFQYGNMWSDLSAWSGSPDSLRGLDNPNIEGGAISNMQDYAKLLLMTLRGGVCGENRVLSEDALAFMREDRAGEFGTPYGMGWWIAAPDTDGEAATVFYDPGAFGAVAWIDTAREIGGYVAIDDYSRTDSGAPVQLVLEEIIAMVAEEVDRARAEAAN